jgi:hypothetical protein
MSQSAADPLAALARLIGQDDPFLNLRRYPSVRQIPFKYHTLAYGPVFAYEARGTFATCVTALDVTVQCSHDELLPFDPDAAGADLIEVLDDEISEMMSPHMDGGSFKYQPPRRSRIGAYLFEMNIWQGALHE